MKLGSTNTSSSEDNLTLAEIKNNLPKTEPKASFKTTRYELIKYKRSCVFKCSKCENTENSVKIY